MTCTVVRPTAGEFLNQETDDHSSQSITSSKDVKMSNWTAAEIQEMLFSLCSCLHCLLVVVAASYERSIHPSSVLSMYAA